MGVARFPLRDRYQTLETLHAVTPPQPGCQSAALNLCVAREMWSIFSLVLAERRMGGSVAGTSGAGAGGSGAGGSGAGGNAATGGQGGSSGLGGHAGSSVAGSGGSSGMNASGGSDLGGTSRDAMEEPADDAGCGCRAGASSSNMPAGALALLLVGLAAALRPSRRTE